MEPFDADDVDPPGAYRLPPPPDDRLWRHPSELADGTTVGRRASRSHRWSTVVLAAAAGSIGTVGVLAAGGALDVREPGPRTTIVRPAASTADATLAPFDAMAAAEPTLAAVVRLEVIGASAAMLGSGVLFTADGHLMTNAHVVADAEAISAVLADGRRLTGTLVGVDLETDMAVVRLVGEGPFPVAAFGPSDEVAVGKPAVVVSASHRSGNTPAVTVGQISGLGREVRSDGGLSLLDMIQTDASMAPGSSGGALVDTHGRVVGICTAFEVVDGRLAAGYATPVDVAKAVASDLVSGGTYRPGWLGVRGADRADGAVVLVSVIDASPAAQAGLRPDDVVLAIDRKPLAGMSTMRIAMRVRHPGDQVTISYQRGADLLEGTVVLGTRPPA
ncbi:MAG: S1C family serine protease [Acidimicrobiia bacterium]